MSTIMEAVLKLQREEKMELMHALPKLTSM